MPRPSIDSTELPQLNPRTHCVLIPRDPHVVYAYWNYTEDDIMSLRQQFKSKDAKPRLILRVYELTQGEFDGSNARRSLDHDVGDTAKNWYIQVWHDNAQYCAELGFRSAGNHFLPLTRSNTVRTPPKTTSSRNDLILQDINVQKESKPYLKENIKERYQGKMHQQSNKKSQQVKQMKRSRTYQLTVQNIRDYYRNLFTTMSHKSKGRLQAFSLQGLVKGIPGDITWQKVQPIKTTSYTVKRVHGGASEMGLIETEGASENALRSQSSGSEDRLKGRKFFFEVWTELIVHGRTEADAKVLLNQQGVKLNPDGTFSIRYALPDGEIPLKLIAQSADGIEERHINTRVEREKTVCFPKILKDPHGP